MKNNFDRLQKTIGAKDSALQGNLFISRVHCILTTNYVAVQQLMQVKIAMAMKEQKEKV